MHTKISDLPNIDPEQLDVPTIDKLAEVGGFDHPPRILLLYGSLRERSFSRFLTEEAARILVHLGADVKIFDPSELPMAGSVPETHPKVVALRDLCIWSEGQVWCSPERHGAVAGTLDAHVHDPEPVVGADGVQGIRRGRADAAVGVLRQGGRRDGGVVQDNSLDARTQQLFDRPLQ
jgi:arsenic resistance protein ArsH